MSFFIFLIIVKGYFREYKNSYLILNNYNNLPVYLNSSIFVYSAVRNIKKTLLLFYLVHYNSYFY